MDETVLVRVHEHLKAACDDPSTQLDQKLLDRIDRYCSGYKVTYEIRAGSLETDA